MNRLDYLKSLKNQQDQESVDKLQLPAWKRKSHDVGELFFVKRRQWKNAGGFTTNEKKKGHPGLVTIKSKRSSGTFMLVPGTSAEPRGLMMFFCPKKEIQYTEKSFKQKKSSFVLDSNISKFSQTVRFLGLTDLIFNFLMTKSSSFDFERSCGT